MALDKQSILAATDSQLSEVDVPEWGGTVHIRSMTSLERDRYESEWLTFREKQNGDRTDMSHFRAFLAARVICDADGVRLFTDADVQNLSNKSGLALARITDAAIRLNGLFGTDAEDDEKK